MFYHGIMLDEHHELHNREMHISGKFVLCHDDQIHDQIKLDDREKQIVELLREEADLMRKEMAERLECSDSTIKRTLQSMVEKGAIKRIGSNKKGEWIILEGK
ncbi:DeoR-like helix-turn-helix domain-containing protein [Lachnospiraceae bacterium RM5]|nr:DeoR-like helix-turn-helix domain-containing protein [Lachnospiraceae bacterium RM5]